MEFGKVALTDLDRIDFRLPSDDPRTVAALAKSRATQPRIGVGAPVWGVKEWAGKVYPLGTGSKDYLYHYSRQFNSIELNTTHYRIPDAETIKRWKGSTPDGFRFCPKFPQEISHHSPLSSRTALAKEFIKSVMGLEDRLGLSFLQLPPHFSPGDLKDLAAFVRELPTDFPLAVEVRHPAFFHDHLIHDALYDLFNARGLSLVITDVAGRRDVLHTSLTSKRVLVRLIGNDLHPTDDVRIASWVERIQTWLALGLEQVEFFLHQPGDLTAPDSIGQFIDQLNAAAGLSIANWKPMNKGEQLGFF